MSEPEEYERAAGRIALWSAMDLIAGAIAKFAARTASKLGPVFRLGVPRRAMVVLAGIEAKRRVANKKRRLSPQSRSREISCRPVHE